MHKIESYINLLVHDLRSIMAEKFRSRTTGFHENSYLWVFETRIVILDDQFLFLFSFSVMYLRSAVWCVLTAFEFDPGGRQVISLVSPTPAKTSPVFTMAKMIHFNSKGHEQHVLLVSSLQNIEEYIPLFEQ